MKQTSLLEARPPIEFSVAGAPLPQGSKVAMVSGKRTRDKWGAVWVKNPIASMVEQSDRKTKTRPAGALKTWRNRIEDAAISARQGEVDLWRGPILLECEFVLPRSPSHYTSKGNLTKSAPTIPQNDLDKLIRAVGDALSSVVYCDDVQVVGFGASTKRFANSATAIGGVRVKLTEL